MKRLLKFLLILLLGSAKGFAQSLYLSTGSNVFVQNGATLSVDGITLKPTADYNITGLNSFTRTATATPPPPSTYVQRVYQFLQTLSGYNGGIIFNYADAELNGLNEADLNLTLYDGRVWKTYPSSRDAVNNLVTASGLTDISMAQATLTAIVNAPLPVTLLSFTAQANNCTAALAWTTASEQNSKAFEVLASSDGTNYIVAGTVAAMGNSSTEKKYNYSANLTQSLTYFRLRMIDNSGTAKFSNVVTVRSNCGKMILSAYPNPVVNRLTIEGLESKNRLLVVDNLGKVVMTLATSNRTETIDVSRLAAGTYTLQVWQNEKVVANLKFLKQ